MNQTLDTSNDNLQKSLGREQELSSSLRTALADAEQAREAEAQAKESLDRSLYFRRVALAYAEFRAGELAHARQLLDECPRSLRNWEWKYVHRLCHEEIRVLDGLPDAQQLTFSREGSHIGVIGYKDGGIAISETVSGRRLLTLTPEQPCSGYCMAFSPDAMKVAAVLKTKDSLTLRVWDLKSGREICVYRQTRSDLAHASLAFTADGENIILAVSDRGFRSVPWDDVEGSLALKGASSIKIINASNGQLLSDQEFPHGTLIQVSPAGDRVLAGTKQDEGLAIYETATGELETVLTEDSYGVAIGPVFSVDGSTVLTRIDGGAVIWDVQSGERMASVDAERNDLALNGDGSRIASYSRTTGWIKIYDTQTGSLIREFAGYRLQNLAFDPTRKFILAGTAKSSIHIWDTQLLVQPLRLEGHENRVDRVKFSSDGDRLTSISNDTISIWDANSGVSLARLPRNSRAPLPAIISADGELIAESVFLPRFRGQVLIRDTRTGRVLRAIDHDAPIQIAAFSPDGRWLLGGVGPNIGAMAKVLALLGISADTPQRSRIPIAEVTADSPADNAGLKNGDVMRVWEIEPELEDIRPGTRLKLRVRIDAAEIVLETEITEWPRQLNDEFILWDVQTGEKSRVLKRPASELLKAAFDVGSAAFVRFSPDGTHFVVAGSENLESCTIHAIANGTYSRPTGPGTRIQGNDLQSETGFGNLWDWANGKRVRIWEDWAAMSPDHRRIAEGGVYQMGHSPPRSSRPDGGLNLVDAVSGQIVLSIKGDDASARLPAECFDFSPDGKKLAVGLSQGMVNIWDSSSLRGQE